ncbi:hypothetical protein GCM10027425_02450 [Alteromonas gracilis]
MASDDGGEMLPFTPRDHDVRIERGGWIFYVRGVKRFESLRTETAWDGHPASLPLLAVVKLIAFVSREAQDTWKVGVLRCPSGWFGGLIRVVHQETLPPEVHPQERIAELVAEVEAGAFDV